jgi:two-component system, NarL family, sensor histidine kinase BarA
MTGGAVLTSMDPLGSPLALGQLLDALSLEDILGSFYALFRIPIRILNEDGATLARSRKPSALNDYLGQLPRAAQMLGELHTSLRQREPDEAGEFGQKAFSGASYHVAMIGHEGRRIGRFILGPFLTPDVNQAPVELLTCDPGIDPAHARELLLRLPRIREDTVKAIARHLAVTLDALIFAGHRALLTEYMHLSTVQENFRQSEERSSDGHARHPPSGRAAAARLLSTVAQELRGPLTRLAEQTERLAGAGAPQGEQRAVVLEIGKQASELLTLESRLRELSQAASGALILNREPLEPRALLERVREELSSLAPERANDLRVYCEEGLSSFCADGARLGQVLKLLGENALFGTEGPVLLEARRVRPPELADGELSDGFVLLGSPRPSLELRVVDSGPGIPDSEKQGVFESLYANSDEAGYRMARSKLGLAIVKPVLEAHDGTVRIEDNLPRGAVFILTLPVVAS